MHFSHSEIVVQREYAEMHIIYIAYLYGNKFMYKDSCELDIKSSAMHCIFNCHSLKIQFFSCFMNLLWIF